MCRPTTLWASSLGSVVTPISVTKARRPTGKGVLEKLSLLVFTIRGGWDRDQPLAVVLVTQMCLVMGKMACQPVDLVCAHETPKLP